MHLKNWKAKRAGGRITVYGTDVETGDENAKIVGVDAVYPTADSGASGHIWAKDKHGDLHKLALG